MAHRIQMMETGEGRTSSWKDYLNTKELATLSDADANAKGYRLWAAANGAMGVIYLGCLVASGGSVGLPGLAISSVASAFCAYRHAAKKGIIDELRTTAVTRAVAQNQRAPLPR